MNAKYAFFKSRSPSSVLMASVFAAFAIIICAATVAPELNRPFSMGFPWREAQTALGVQAIYNNEGWAFYPALCPPWRLAYEFPAYQAMTAFFSKASGNSVIFSGRLVSAIMFVVSAAAVGMLVHLFSKNKVASLLAFGGVIINPYYLSWSTAFLLESTVLAFSMWGLYFSARKNLVVASIFLSAGMAVKATTAAPFLLIAALLIGLDFLKNHSPRRAIIAVMAIIVIPLGAGVAWTNEADSIKEASGYARLLSNRGAPMKKWAYGNLAQRVDAKTWSVIFQRIFATNGGWPFALCLILSLVLLPFNPLWRESAACLLGWGAPLVVFTNLYYVHEYYAIANNVLLLLFIALALTGAAQLRGWQKPLAIVTTIIILSAYTSKSFSVAPTAAPTKMSLALTGAGEWIKSNTPPDSVLIVTGAAWNPLLSFVSGRKTMMVPDWEELRQDEVTSAVAALPKEHVFFIDASPVGRGSKLARNAIATTGLTVSELTPPQPKK